ncbi:hypothetical protein BKA62DRAFT_774251 [Auriculariales sp. MPI-PUGE-AT-0066]|nr:hypothetical protein BKA62DRAFT_774251 [Auriculariales sp. MPI-PUGE-AT-0066]
MASAQPDSDSAPDTSSLPTFEAPGASDAHTSILLSVHHRCVGTGGRFKGTETTFGGFPEKLQHILGATIEQASVECVVFPAYETKGDLQAAVERFSDWLCSLTVEKECAHGAGGGAGKARIVLCGHSMGGLLAADTLIAFFNSRVDAAAPLWPNIIACIAFDTPYLGLHPGVFKSQADQALSYVQTARDVAGSLGFFGALGKKMSETPAPAPGKAPPASSPQTPSESSQNHALVQTAPKAQNAPAAPSNSWSAWAPAVGGLLAAGVAAGAAAYYQREITGGIKQAQQGVTGGWTWANDHMKYVGNLWDEKALQARLDTLMLLRKSHGVWFQNFYTVLDSTTGLSGTRTFCVLPRRGTPGAAAFVASHNKLAQDEVNAHISMFNPKMNDGYYDLGLQTARIIHDVMLSDNSLRQKQD